MNPFYLARKGLAISIGNLSADLSGALLDVGCGSKPYQDLFSVSSYIGLDIDSERSRRDGAADVFYTGDHFPFEGETFNAVLTTQVLEHVFDPDLFVAEVVRVLKPRGKVLLTVPFMWDEHEQPADYARYTSFGIRYLLEKHGLVVEKQMKIGEGFALLYQLRAAYIFKVFQKRSLLTRAVVQLLFILPSTIAGLILQKFLPAENDMYLDNLILAQKA